MALARRASGPAGPSRASASAVQTPSTVLWRSSCPWLPARQARAGAVVVRAAKQADKQAYKPATAKDAIESGLKAFHGRKDYDEAARLFKAAMDMSPSDDEARAALYNLGCAYNKAKQYKLAAESITRAINDYSLKLAVALKDEDLAELRDRREWIDAMTEVKGGMSRKAKIDLRSEAKAPFRLARIILFGGFGFSAAVGLFIITARLIAALKGGEGAPDLQETAQNFGINTAVVAVLGFLVWRDLQAKDKAVKVTSREEVLSRLQLKLGADRVLPLIRFRGQVRPVILAGTRQFVELALKQAEPSYLNLRDRGVSVIPVILDAKDDKIGREEDPDYKIKMLKKEFQESQKAEGRGFGAGSKAPAAAEAEGAKPEASEEEAMKKSKAMGGMVEEDRKWRLEAYDTAEWKAWVNEQREYAKLPPSEKNCWIQVQLDGTVRASGVGLPVWTKLVEALPSLDSMRTRFSDGVGTSV